MVPLLRESDRQEEVYVICGETPKKKIAIGLLPSFVRGRE
jgi:hypothetical protein